MLLPLVIKAPGCFHPYDIVAKGMGLCSRPWHQKDQGIHYLFDALCTPLFRDRVCHICMQSIALHQTFMEHLIVGHVELKLNSVDEVLGNVADSDPIIFIIGQC